MPDQTKKFTPEVGDVAGEQGRFHDIDVNRLTGFMFGSRPMLAVDGTDPHGNKRHLEVAANKPHSDEGIAGLFYSNAWQDVPTGVRDEIEAQMIAPLMVESARNATTRLDKRTGLIIGELPKLAEPKITLQQAIEARKTLG